MNEQIRKTYPISWVVMQNTIQECFKSMSIDEKRLLIIASPAARIIDATEKDAIIITAESFAQECNIKTHSAYKSLVDASKSLIKRYFCYLDEKGRKTYCNWVIRARYDEGSVSICFPDEVLLMLKEFDKLNPYTKYKKNIVLSLKKDYSFFELNEGRDDKTTKKNIITMLKKNCPDTKFSVRKEYYDCYGISWTNGAAEEEVDKIITDNSKF